VPKKSAFTDPGKWWIYRNARGHWDISPPVVHNVEWPGCTVVTTGATAIAAYAKRACR